MPREKILRHPHRGSVDWGVAGRTTTRYEAPSAVADVAEMLMRNTPANAAAIASFEDPGAERPLLVVAHPGHELRVHAWLHRERPGVLVITDGSGRQASGRVARTAAILERAGAAPGRLFGRYSDARLYRALLACDVEFAVGVVEEIVAAVQSWRSRVVVSDALEGFNPGHDLCAACVDVAAAVLARRHGHDVSRLDFLLDGVELGGSRPRRRDEVVIRVDPTALAQKLRDVREYEEIALDVGSLLARHGEDALHDEVLRPVAGSRALREPPEPPGYERVGEQRRAAGHYSEVIRRREHFLPLVRALHRHFDLPVS